MITATLKTALEEAGCDFILYESSQLANLLTDQSKPDDLIGLILQPTDITLKVRANAVHELYPPIKIEILKQTILEDTAENNEETLEALLQIAKDFIREIIKTAEFQKVKDVVATKVLENRYDANVIGWSLAIDLNLIENVSC